MIWWLVKKLLLQTENSCNLLTTRQWTGPSGISSGLTSVLSRKIMRIAVLSMLKKSFCLRLASQFKCLVFFYRFICVYKVPFTLETDLEESNTSIKLFFTN
jgi:hypothetical protein